MQININKWKKFPYPIKLDILNLVEDIIELENGTVNEICVTFVDNTFISQLNKDYLNHDYPTDVIAFTLSEADEPLNADIYISFDQAKLQAKEYGITTANEITRLIVHGVLHTLGYDHKTKTEASVMSNKEDFWINKFYPGS